MTIDWRRLGLFDQIGKFRSGAFALAVFPTAFTFSPELTFDIVPECCFVRSPIPNRQGRNHAAASAALLSATALLTRSRKRFNRSKFDAHQAKTRVIYCWALTAVPLAPAARRTLDKATQQRPALAPSTQPREPRSKGRRRSA